MKRLLTQLKALALGLCLSSAYFPAAVQAHTGDPAAETMADFINSPIVSADSATPMAMIATSNDHQLYLKAYNDFSDLDPDKSDGIETTYKHSFDYYGYFDSYKCYDHNGSIFVPASTTTDKYCSGKWSGNFLNWATMTRIDTVRKILFGGLRSTDTSASTILERSYLPNDAHAFAKYYNGSDINKLTPFTPPIASGTPANDGLTICNTTVNNTNLVSNGNPNNPVTDPPLLRVASGNYSLWAGNERWQCRWDEEQSAVNDNDPAQSGIDAHGSNPVKATDGLGSKDYIVRVQVCVTGLEEKNCKKYPTSNHKKPTGLLQTYGDDDKILFGMMGGSYSKNKTGGILVKNIGSMTDEIDVTGDGHFTDAVTSGKAANQADGIINAWSLYRMVDYKHSDGSYGLGTLNSSNCPYGITSFSNGQCKSWGNPFSEIYLSAIRYMSGESPSGSSRANDSAVIKGLNTPNQWQCPLDDTNYCASLNVIAFNSSTLSYDDDDLDGTSDGVKSIWSGNPTSVELTNVIGDGEGITGGSYFVGENGTDNNQLCTQKTITELGKVKGLCPDSPRLKGTYHVAGIAHKAHMDDIRSAHVGTSRKLEGDQLVDTYAVTLAPSVPEISVPVPGTSKEVKILPACYNDRDGNYCVIVDFKIVEPHTVSGSTATGKFYVNWENAEQGSDFDQDLWGYIEYSVTSTGITVTTDTIAESSGAAMGFGYIISGTTQDGMHMHSGANHYAYTDPTGASSCTDCISEEDSGSTGPTSNTYTISASGSSGLLKDPLYYAAKWGAFKDENGNNIPDLQSEWDRKDGAGKLNPDGIPDTYYYATNPEELEKSLTNVFNAILAKTASGTAASVVASSRQGQGTVVQALYVTERTYDNKTVNWVGTLHALWVDRAGNIREDSNSNAELDDYSVDKVVKVYYDSSTRQTRVCKFDSSDAETFTPIILNAGADCEANSLPLEDMKTLWNAREQLSALSSASITSQRTYTSPASGGRYIKTFLDADKDGVVDGGEYVDFTPAGINTTANHGYLNATSQTSADTIINYIRGEESASTRNRTIDFDGDGTDEVMRLGDIVHSTPTLVSTPGEAFDQLYGDSTYATFRAQYVDRRQMVYVGANDGLLHAFNAGFFDPVNIKFTLTSSGGSETAHPLGSELWAYAPSNLLPHLKWLSDPAYSHVYYMDAKPRAFDAKIFTADATHPGGWGTVLVAGMRFGGGTMTVDAAQDGLGTGTDFTTRSAYVVFDITDPEQPPDLIAEITNPALGFTTSYPTAMAVRENDNSPNKWFLVFGTGPTDDSTATSSQDGRLLVYDLSTKTWAPGFGFSGTKNVVGANSFVSDPIAADWDLDYKANDLYVGTVSGTEANPTGSLYRLVVDGDDDPANWTFASRLNTGRSIVMRPTLSVDKKFNRWIYAGTGRFFVNTDKTSAVQQTLYGFRDNPATGDTTALPATTNMVDVTSAVVSTDGSTTPPYAVTGVSGVTSFSELEGLFDKTGTDWKDGWKLDLAMPAAAGDPSARMVKEGALLGNVFLITDFTPSINLCGGDGNSGLFGLYYKTGTAFAESPILGQTGTTATRYVDLGEGLASAPSLHVTNNPPDNNGTEETVIIQNSRGDIITEEADLPTPVKSGETSWREEYE